MSELSPSEVLCVPKRKRLTHSRFKNDEGQEILHLFYGEVELIFDEPDLAPMGEKLLELERFRAEEAMSWSNAEPHSWDKIRELLQALLDQRVLKKVAEEGAEAAETFPLRLGLAPEDREPRTFSAHDDRCPALTMEAFGREFDLPNLEALVPIYRIAHPAMDTDGRQVGENNVVPRSLFLDLPTQRRICNYPGSRFQDDLPMNVTALKSMAKRWPEHLSLTEQYRQALFARLPPRDPTALCAGELHFLAVGMLAAVGYVMVRGENPVPNGQLDGGLSAIFRLVDGVRLVTSDLLHEHVDGSGYRTSVSAQSIADYADHYAVYRGNLGVCAGPPALIDEYLRVLFGEMAAPIQVEPSLAERLGDLDAAIDYGLLGQRVECAIRFCGTSQGLLHLRLQEAFAGQKGRTKLQELLEVPIDREHYPLLRDTHPTQGAFWVDRENSRWLFSRAALGLRSLVDETPLERLMALDPRAQEFDRGRLAEALAPVMSSNFGADLVHQVAAVAADAFALERRCLRVVGREQGKLNERLRRPSGRKLTNDDLAAYTLLRNGPPLYQTLAEGLGISISTDADSTVVRCGDSTVTLTN